MFDYYTYPLRCFAVGWPKPDYWFVADARGVRVEHLPTFLSVEDCQAEADRINRTHPEDPGREEILSGVGA